MLLLMIGGKLDWLVEFFFSPTQLLINSFMIPLLNSSQLFNDTDQLSNSGLFIRLATICHFVDLKSCILLTPKSMVMWLLCFYNMGLLLKIQWKNLKKYQDLYFFKKPHLFISLKCATVYLYQFILKCLLYWFLTFSWDGEYSIQCY